MVFVKRVGARVITAGLVVVSVWQSQTAFWNSSTSNNKNKNKNKNKNDDKKEKKQKKLVEVTKTKLDSEDGCGMVSRASLSATDKMVPKWRNFSASEIQELREITSCLNKIANFRGLKKNARNPVRPDIFTRGVTLDCSLPVNLELVRQTISRYRQVWFIGDSLLTQQFEVLACTLAEQQDSATTTPLILQTATDKSIPYPMGNHLTWQHKYHSTGNSTTLLMHKLWGFKQEPTEATLYQTHFITALKTLTEHDAIVMNAAVHYNAPDVLKLAQALQFIKAKAASTSTLPTIFFLEDVPQEWHTSNGMHSTWLNCLDKKRPCRCQVLDEARLQGRGSVQPAAILRYRSTTNHMKTNDTTNTTLSSSAFAIFQHLYSNITTKDHILWMMTTSENCIPTCLPATWRMDVARKILLEDNDSFFFDNKINSSNHNKSTNNNNTNNNGKLVYVPRFWQFVAKAGNGRPSGKGARGMPPNQNDCTHKSLDTILMMNQQLIRSMIKTLKTTTTTTTTK